MSSVFTREKLRRRHTLASLPYTLVSIITGAVMSMRCRGRRLLILRRRLLTPSVMNSSSHGKRARSALTAIQLIRERMPGTPSLMSLKDAHEMKFLSSRCYLASLSRNARRLGPGCPPPSPSLPRPPPRVCSSFGISTDVIITFSRLTLDKRVDFRPPDVMPPTHSGVSPEISATRW